MNHTLQLMNLFKRPIRGILKGFFQLNGSNRQETNKQQLRKAGKANFLKSIMTFDTTENVKGHKPKRGFDSRKLRIDIRKVKRKTRAMKEEEKIDTKRINQKRNE